MWDFVIYAILLLALSAWHLRRRHLAHARSVAARQAAQESGLREPMSLHPVIDPSRCIGCGACVRACPEQAEHYVLGLVSGKAELVSPADCIGHGTCRIACPVDAIQLVLGTATRGVDIPVLSPQFESAVAGIFVAGELGGMGLIKNALEQGRQAVEVIANDRPRGGEALDLIIVGAGPAGFAASLTAKQLGLRFQTLEQDSLGGTVFQYPRGKVVMTSPAKLPLIGKMSFRTAPKEELLEFWRRAEGKAQLKLNYQERVESINHDGNCFSVRSTKGAYRAHSVLLAIGRRGTPRKLDVSGEELPKVVYRLIEPEQYAGQRVLVVGGGDSALEAAASIAEESPTAQVTLSHRAEAFARAKAKNRERVRLAQQAGRIRVLMKSEVRKIDHDRVHLLHQGRDVEIANDAVIICAGGVLPSEFLRTMGIEVETKYGTA